MQDYLSPVRIALDTTYDMKKREEVMGSDRHQT